MMKKSIMALVVLLVALPAMATVITATHEGNRVVSINYNASGDPCNIRAFALDITVDSDANITDINNYHVGESNSSGKGFGIFPGTIDVNATTGDVDDYNIPVAPYSDLPSDTQLGLGTGGITIEMGSLYVGDGNRPDPCGILCKITVDADCTLTVAANVSRAPNGVVLEDSNNAAVDYSGAQNVPVALVVDCFPAAHPDYDEWKDVVGEPNCWCYDRQCHGDVDDTAQGKFNYWVSTYDLGVLREAWSLPYPDLIDGNGDHLTTNVGGKDVALICADFDHAPQGKFNYRVSTFDLGILRDNWSLPDLPDPNCFDGY